MNNGVRLQQFPSRIGLVTTVMLLVGMLLPALHENASALQNTGLVNDATYAAATGQTVTWNPPWMFDDGSLIAGDAVDMVFLRGEDAIGVVGMGDFQPEQARSLVFGYLGGNTELTITIDQGSSGQISYWLDSVPMNGTTFGAFTIATMTGTPGEQNATMAMVFAPIAGFADAVALAQGGIAIDSEPMLFGVDGTGLQSTLETARPPVGSTPERAETAFVPIDSWVDPVFGVPVEWAEGWESAGARNENTLMLMNPSIGLFINLTPMERQGMTPDDWAAWLSEAPAGVTDWQIEPPIVNPNNCIVQCSADSIDMVNEVIFLDGQETIVLVTVALATPDVDASIVTYQATVRIGGRVPLDGWGGSPTTIPASTAAVASEQEGSLADAGLVADGHYVSPQFGVEILWDDTWTLDTSIDPPISTDPARQVDHLYLMQSDNDATWVVLETVPFFGVGVEQIVEFASAPGTATELYGPNAEILLTTATADRGGIVIVERSGLIPRIYYEEYIMVDASTLVMLRFSAPVSVVDTALPSAQSITASGVPILSQFSAQDIQVAVVG